MADIYVAPEKRQAAPEKKVAPLAKPISRQKKIKAIKKKLAAGDSLNSLIGRRRGHLWSAFVARPRGVNFESQGDGEKIILLLRRHWITNLRWLAIALLLALAPFVLGQAPFMTGFPARFQFAALVSWYLLVLAYVIQQALSWFFNVGIITNRRVVDIDFFSLIHKRISDADLDKIQDITFNISGALRTVFNYGTVFIQTAAEKPELSFENVPNPALVAKVLEKLTAKNE